jgi:hypothetical protein
MGATVTTKKRKPFYQSVNVDIDIDASVLEDAGYHHEEDCPAHETDLTDHETNIRALNDWHDHHHGLSLWASCPYEPCKLLTDEFRRTA